MKCIRIRKRKIVVLQCEQCKITSDLVEFKPRSKKHPMCLSCADSFIKCSRCKKALPKESFATCQNTKTGRQYYCFGCQKNKREIRKGMDQVCAKCNKAKAFSEFPLSTITKNGRFSECFECCPQSPNYDFTDNKNNYAQHYHQYFGVERNILDPKNFFD